MVSISFSDFIICRQVPGKRWENMRREKHEGEKIIWKPYFFCLQMLGMVMAQISGWNSDKMGFSFMNVILAHRLTARSVSRIMFFTCPPKNPYFIKINICMTFQTTACLFFSEIIFSEYNWILLFNILDHGDSSQCLVTFDAWMQWKDKKLKT